MARYGCPECGNRMSVGWINGEVAIACRCGLGCVMEWDGEINSAFLRFLRHYDMGGRPNVGGRLGVLEGRPADAPPARPKPRRAAKAPPNASASTPRGGRPARPKPRRAAKAPPNASASTPRGGRPARPKPRPGRKRGDSGYSAMSAGSDDTERPYATAPKVRSASEIDEMIGSKDPDSTAQKILRTKQDYVCWYQVSDSPGPPPGDDVRRAGLDEALAAYLEGRGISKLHRFQQESFGAIVGGKDTVIVAPTASGKTEAFLVPIMQMLAEGRRPVFALLIYPTKALARDQNAKVSGMAASVGARSAVFDGDTSHSQRRTILDAPPHILVTNFDVINYHLPRHTEFATLLRTAKIAVMDEIHTYTGIFGSNVHHVVRRLDRACGGLQMVAASATIREPERFCSQLLDRDVRVVRTDGRKGRIDTMILYPSMRMQRQMMLDVAGILTARGHKTLVFSNSHRAAELFAIGAKRAGMRVEVHRAGLSARHRLRVEDRFRNGNLMAISCTPTLELGVDIGAVDGVVSAVTPVNRLLQRVGRAARQGQRGYAVLALGNDPISQYYGNSPEDYFEDVEMSYIDPENPTVLRYHLAAAVCDAPLPFKNVPAKYADAIQDCIDEGLMDNRGGVLVPNRARTGRLLDGHNIRGMGSVVRIVLNGRTVGERSLPMALSELHAGATYYMAGSAYRVESLDMSGVRRAVLSRAGYRAPRTRPIVTVKPSLRSTFATKTVWNMQVAHCGLNIRQTVTGYVTMQNNRISSPVMLDSPVSFDFYTKGVVFCAPVVDAADSTDPASAYHAAEHVIIEGSNMIIGGAAKDMGGISLNDTGAIFVYDAAIGGNGASRALYDRIKDVVSRSAQILRLCPCANEAGCPRCTHSYSCGNNNTRLNKDAALRVLDGIMDGERCDLNIPTKDTVALV